MDNNVINLFAPPKESTSDQIVKTYIGHFLDWATENGIDTSTIEFKYDAAVIMTIIKSLLHKKDSHES